jgi:hypothetical protein
MNEMTSADALRRLCEVWEWALASKRPYFGYLLGTAILAFDMDRGPGKFTPPNTKPLRLDALKKPKRGRPPKQRP